MKKILVLFLVMAMVLSMAACDSGFGVADDSVDGAATGAVQDTTTVPDVTDENTEPEDTENSSNVTTNIEGGDGDREWKVGDCNVYIHDDAYLLTEDEETDLLNIVAKYANDTYFNILFFTYYDAHGATTKDYTDTYMDMLFPDQEDNIAFIVDMDNGEVYINTMGKAIQWVDDYAIDAAFDVSWEYVENEEYGEFLKVVAGYCLQIIANGGHK